MTKRHLQFKAQAQQPSVFEIQWNEFKTIAITFIIVRQSKKGNFFTIVSQFLPSWPLVEMVQIQQKRLREISQFVFLRRQYNRHIWLPPMRTILPVYRKTMHIRGCYGDYMRRQHCGRRCCSQPLCSGWHAVCSKTSRYLRCVCVCAVIFPPFNAATSGSSKFELKVARSISG